MNRTGRRTIVAGSIALALFLCPAAAGAQTIQSVIRAETVGLTRTVTAGAGAVDTIQLALGLNEIYDRDPSSQAHAVRFRRLRRSNSSRSFPCAQVVAT